MEKNSLRIRMKAKGAYLGDSMLILAPCFIAFLRWGLKALCFYYFFSRGGGNSCVSTIFWRRLTVKDGWGRSDELPYSYQEEGVSKMAK